jgi:hypothetical protein
MPVLHCVSDIGSLDQVLNDNRRLAVDHIGRRLLRRIFGKSLAPASIPVRFQVLVHNIGGHDQVDYELAQAHPFAFGLPPYGNRRYLFSPQRAAC